MGLDMYLIKKVNDGLNVPRNGFRFEGFWRKLPEGTLLLDNRGISENISDGELITRIMIGAGQHTASKKGKGDFEEIFKWRKANAIHGWFVKNVQNGRENGKVFLIKKGQLNKLKQVCEAVLSDKSLASKLLPTFEGFLFGSYEYDENYFYHVKETFELLETLNLDEEYYYDAWA